MTRGATLSRDRTNALKTKREIQAHLFTYLLIIQKTTSKIRALFLNNFNY